MVRAKKASPCPSRSRRRKLHSQDSTLTDYERHRQQRIKENEDKLAALNLPVLASSFQKSSPSPSPSKRKNIREDEDDDYVPSDDESASDLDESNKNKPSLVVFQEGVANDDEDNALKQALALSMQEGSDHVAGTTCKKSGRQRDSKRTAATTRKRTKGRQEYLLTNDDIAAIFSVFDGQGKGKFSIADLERVACSHDFNWNREEITDMIDVFDKNKDGLLDLAEFQGIFGKAGMLKVNTA